MLVSLVRGNNMHILYLILYFILSPLLFTIPLFILFVGVPILLFGIPELLWRGCKRVLFPTVTTAPSITLTPTIAPIKRKPYKPKGKRSKIAGIRRNRAILYIAKGGDHA